MLKSNYFASASVHRIEKTIKAAVAATVAGLLLAWIGESNSPQSNPWPVTKRLIYMLKRQKISKFSHFRQST